MRVYTEKISSKAPQNATATPASSIVLDANTERRYALIVNDGSAVVYLALYPTAELNKGIRLNAAGGSYELSYVNAYTGPVSAISSSGNVNLCIYEG